MQLQEQAYTVTAITRRIKATLEGDLAEVWVEGEISNYIHHSSGHRYFSLKDDNAVLKVTIWRSTGSRLKFEPANGHKVIIYGDINVYEKGGQYQLNCRRILPAGLGELELAYRQLHQRLETEGLFAQERKKRLPDYVRKIGIVTSPTGAAIRDMINVARRRNSAVELIIYPATVQGGGAEKTIASGIEYFNSREDIDIIIIGRGGGSLEDLWPFNTEITVRAVVASTIPVVSAVGHEIDTTLSDLVADLRAPTPSAASEMTIRSRSDIIAQIVGELQYQRTIITKILQSSRDRLLAQLGRPIWKHPYNMIQQRQQHLDQLVKLMEVAGKNSFEIYRNRLSLALSRLDTLSPLKIMTRGYSVTRRLSDERIVYRKTDVAIGDEIETMISDGKIVSVVSDIESRGYDPG